MHAMVFQVKIHDREEAQRILNEQIVPGVSGAPGFVTGYWVETADDAGISVVVFESEEAVNQAAASGPRPESDALSVESFTIGAVVAHA
jgi:heme-degrading monooxygenase HmoA